LAADKNLLLWRNSGIIRYNCGFGEGPAGSLGVAREIAVDAQSPLIFLEFVSKISGTEIKTTQS
jgi:hypothetical protein